MLLPGFLRIAVAAFSSMVIHSAAGTITMGSSLAAGCLVQRGAQTVLWTNQVNAHRELTAGLDCALDLGIRSLVRAHGVERNIRERGHGSG